MDAIEELSPKRLVARDLVANVITLGVCVAIQLLILVSRGPSHAQWPIYVGALGGLFGIACISTAMARRGWVAQAMHLYAWSGMAAITAMTIAAMQPEDNLPTLIVLLICAGETWLFQTLNWPSALVYGIAALGVFIGLGCAYGQLDDVLPAILLLGLAAALGSRLWHYNQLRTGVREWVNGRRASGI